MSHEAGPGRRPTGADAPKVLHLDHTTVAGGAEFALLRMLQVGAPWSPSIMLAPTDDEGLGVYEALPADVPCRVVGVRQPAGVSWGGFGLQVLATVRLAIQAVATRLQREFRTADLVDANTARAAAYGALAARFSRVPFVVHVRDMTDRDALGRTGHFLMRRVILPRADGIISDTHPPLDSARPYLKPDALMSVIPSASGIRLREAPPVRTQGGLRVGMLARIDPWKGQRVLLDAFAEAFAGTDARLEFAGAAPFGHEDFLAELQDRAAELGVADQVVFHGHVDDVDALIEEWDVAVQASTRPEPLGQNVLQYLAAGRAVVVADEGGPTEWVHDGVNGLQFPARDVQGLAAVLRRLDADPALRQRLGVGAASTPGLLDDVEVAEAHATFYNEVIEAVRRRATRGRRAHETIYDDVVRRTATVSSASGPA
ncbi:glycosyltransferase family 4 protein [Agromyces sp. NPDC055661]